jgi:hypothetical protein
MHRQELQAVLLVSPLPFCVTTCWRSLWGCVESRSYATWPSAKHTLRPPIGQLTSARGLAASCTPALVDRTTTIQDNLSHYSKLTKGNVVHTLCIVHMH